MKRRFFLDVGDSVVVWDDSPKASIQKREGIIRQLFGREAVLVQYQDRVVEEEIVHVRNVYKEIPGLSF